MPSWRTKPLGEVVSFDKRITGDSALRYVGLENIESETGGLIPAESADAIGSAFAFGKAHVLYGRLRPYLNKVLLPDFEGRCSTEIFPLLPGVEVSREFLFYWLLQDETVRAINATCTGARMPRANMNAVLEFPFSYPSLPEQKRIVAILDEAFKGTRIATANAEKNLANARELFESELNTVFKRHAPEWSVAPLSTLAAIKHGFAFKSEYFCESGPHILLTPGNFCEQGGYRDRGEKQKYYDGPVPEGFVLEPGDMLLAMTEQAPGLLGSPMIVPAQGSFLHNQRLGLVQPKSGVPWHPAFFEHAFNTKRFRRLVHRDASGVKVRHTSPEKLGSVLVAFPTTIEKQTEVASRLSALLAETQVLGDAYQQRLIELGRLKASVLSRAFSGQLTATKGLAA